MGLFSRLQPLKGYRLLRRALAELRLVRRALERQADALELAAGNVPRGTGAQAFRSYTSSKTPLSDREVHDLTEVSYVDDRELGALFERESELRALLGRDPTPEEVLRAHAGDLE